MKFMGGKKKDRRSDLSLEDRKNQYSLIIAQ